MIEKVLIIEDEKPNADRLKRLIGNIRPKASVLAVLESITDSIKWFEENDAPDLVMMDVRLSDGLSFDIFDAVKINCAIIFTTAYDEYAVRAFKFDSVDYLLKPVEEEELEAAFSKLERYTQVDLNKSIAGIANFLRPKDYRSRFLLPYRDGYKTVLVEEVVYFYSALKITRARLKNGMEEILPQSMEELELQLDPKLFFRANRQFILHIDSIQHVHNYFHGKLKIMIKKHPDVEVIVSRDKAHLIKAWLDS
ncbi:two component transcriptional regulator, LytTR family [Chitinophaga ginsengisegetis]|uniref:Two component transcriptional regulator, LytTR family n=1 Tax=Chitinophaga ginsengisegetis TaxID=393003 RepID=A0A1T5PB52_9BACT|nr:LytTR family DNA-binding domain-containing protein [Chitinophaga ginsengisegetis]MDR6571305.1 DNA-binding LytR/AlgR family response regulator [Chitinophaga ginsengisegetis]MDR6651039.1 DNA-binding LytR/AlgR family response regulator [Chitinophaga ginsengisegetis]MDR6657389.1 DNA-binding LytR/AlgR family response regulator [Chitinophaga ginsengisegetis]SKD09975.1 two component transcriptional regulator, LytTR family [Chitinophaga ginsengisegetis]